MFISRAVVISDIGLNLRRTAEKGNTYIFLIAFNIDQHYIQHLFFKGVTLLSRRRSQLITDGC